MTFKQPLELGGNVREGESAAANKPASRFNAPFDAGSGPPGRPDEVETNGLGLRSCRIEGLRKGDEPRRKDCRHASTAKGNTSGGVAREQVSNFSQVV